MQLGGPNWGQMKALVNMLVAHLFDADGISADTKTICIQIITCYMVIQCYIKMYILYFICIHYVYYMYILYIYMYIVIYVIDEHTIGEPIYKSSCFSPLARQGIARIPRSSEEFSIY